MNREKTIVRTSIVGIFGNFFLVAFKAFVGIVAKSSSIISDAINNFTDALSSLITIIGTKLSNKKPTKKHPYGFGRIEYISSALIGLIIFAAGVIAVVESIQAIINKETPSHSYWSIIIISVAILVKVGLSILFLIKAKKVHSDALKASGFDALFDAVLSTATLVGIIFSITLNINIEPYLGIAISIFIFKTAFEILYDSISNLLGERIDPAFALEIKRFIIDNFPQVKGCYDLIINKYGENKTIGSIHVEVDDMMTAKEIHILERSILSAIYQKYQMILTVGIYASGSLDAEHMEIKNYVLSLIKDNKDILQIHGFFVDEEKKTISFDIVVSFDNKHPELIRDNLISVLKEKYSAYNFSIIIDQDFSDR